MQKIGCGNLKQQPTQTPAEADVQLLLETLKGTVQALEWCQEGMLREDAKVVQMDIDAAVAVIRKVEK